MLSIKNKDKLNWVLEHAVEIEGATALLNKRLESLSDSLRNEMCANKADEESPFSPENAERLLQLNRHLAKLEEFLNTLQRSLSPALASKVSDPDDPMADYEIEAVLNYTLREDDPEWSDESDNFMTQREEMLKWPSTSFSRRDDFSEHCPGMEAINTEPHCWLFHDLYNHNYGLNKPHVPLRDCLRCCRQRC